MGLTSDVSISPTRAPTALILGGKLLSEVSKSQDLEVSRNIGLLTPEQTPELVI